MGKTFAKKEKDEFMRKNNFHNITTEILEVLRSNETDLLTLE